MMTYISLLLLIIHSQKIGTYKLWLFVSNINRYWNSKNKVNTHKNERFNKVWQVYTILKNGVLFLYILFIWQIGLYQFIKINPRYIITISPIYCTVEVGGLRPRIPNPHRGNPIIGGSSTKNKYAFIPLCFNINLHVTYESCPPITWIMHNTFPTKIVANESFFFFCRKTSHFFKN